MIIALYCVWQSDISLNRQRVDTGVHQCVHGSLTPCSIVSFRHRRVRIESVGKCGLWLYLCFAGSWVSTENARSRFHSSHARKWHRGQDWIVHRGVGSVLDQMVIILLRESRCWRSANEAETISSATEGYRLSKGSQSTLRMASFVGRICRICRNGLWLLVLGGGRYAKH